MVRGEQRVMWAKMLLLIRLDCFSYRYNQEMEYKVLNVLKKHKQGIKTYVVKC